MSESIVAPAIPRLTYLRIKNYRALRDVEFRDLTPLTMLIGPNGSGKSTVLDALAFLAEVIGGDLQGAWERRNRFAGMQTRGSEGSIGFEVHLEVDEESIAYSLEVIESKGEVYIKDERLSEGNKEKKLLFRAKADDEYNITHAVLYSQAESERLKQLVPDEQFGTSASAGSMLFWAMLIGKNKQMKSTRVIQKLRWFFDSYRNIHLTDDHLKGYSDAGPRERLSPNGDNLPNVLYYLHDKHPETFEKIKTQLRRWVPNLADIVTEITSDERLLLRFKDAQFEKPLPAQYMSGGTMRLAALLTLLYEPSATGLLGIEEPDNELHPLLLYRLAEELGKATETRQLLVTTHSPMLLDALAPEQVWILHRGADGYTQATRTADIPNVPELVEDGSPLGYLWTSNAFHVGNPLASFHPRPDAR